MTERTLFVIRNQLGQYLDKHSGWQSGKDSNALFKADHRDEALNTLIEINAKDITLRGRILEVPADDKKRPVVEISEEALALDKIQPGDSNGLFAESAEEAGTIDENDAAEEPETDNGDEETILVIEESVEIIIDNER